MEGDPTVTVEEAMWIATEGAGATVTGATGLAAVEAEMVAMAVIAARPEAEVAVETAKAEVAAEAVKPKAEAAVEAANPRAEAVVVGVEAVGKEPG